MSEDDGEARARPGEAEPDTEARRPSEVPTEAHPPMSALGGPLAEAPKEKQASAPPLTKEERRRRRRRRFSTAIKILVVLLGLLAAAAAYVVGMAPERIRQRMEQRLAERFGGTAAVDRVEIDWSELLVVAHGVRFDDGERFEVDVESLEIDLTLDELIHGSARPTIVVRRPVIAFEAKAATPREPSPRDAQAFASIEIVDGSLELTLPTDRGPAFVDLHEISAQVIAQPEEEVERSLDLGIDASARIGAEGRLRIHGRASSEAPAKAWAVRFELQRFELALLNQLWLEIIEMDVDHGFLALDGELRRTPSRLRGRVRPRFEEITLLGANEDALHPMAEALFGHMLMGARSTIAIDRSMDETESSLPELLDTDWRTLVQSAIRQGYARRLSTLRGFTASIGDVRVELSQGLLQLYDVVIDTEQRRVEAPMVAIERVDVVFDPSVTQAGASAYKHITLWRPAFTFVTGGESRLQFDESWLDTISAIPFPTRTLVVHEGRIDLWELSQAEPVNVFVDDIELRGREMAADLHPVGVRGAELSATATVLDESSASVRVVYEPEAPVPNLDMDMRLEPLALTTLAPALRAFVGVDAVGGEVGFSANLSARDREVEASVVPEVRRPKLKALGQGNLLRKIVIGRALRRMRSRVLELRYGQDPDEGMLQGFFPQLIQAVFLER